MDHPTVAKLWEKIIQLTKDEKVALGETQQIIRQQVWELLPILADAMEEFPNGEGRHEDAQGLREAAKEKEFPWQDLSSGSGSFSWHSMGYEGDDDIAGGEKYSKQGYYPYSNIQEKVFRNMPKGKEKTYDSDQLRTYTTAREAWEAYRKAWARIRSETQKENE